MQQVWIKYVGLEKMPCLFAFHPAINAPFAINSVASDYTVKMTIGTRCGLNERHLATGLMYH
jgi:aldose 1-epimerase